MRHLAASGRAREIGFGQLTEIRLHADLGITLVGPLPEAIGKTTTYAAGLLAAARAPAPATDLVEFMASPAGHALLVASGVQ